MFKSRYQVYRSNINYWSGSSKAILSRYNLCGYFVMSKFYSSCNDMDSTPIHSKLIGSLIAANITGTTRDCYKGRISSSIHRWES